MLRSCRNHFVFNFFLKKIFSNWNISLVKITLDFEIKLMYVSAKGLLNTLTTAQRNKLSICFEMPKYMAWITFSFPFSSCQELKRVLQHWRTPLCVNHDTYTVFNQCTRKTKADRKNKAKLIRKILHGHLAKNSSLWLQLELKGFSQGSYHIVKARLGMLN